MYKTLLFDIDNTLLNFATAEKRALEQLFDDIGVSLTDERLNIYREINGDLWRRHELEGLPIREVLDQRFKLAFNKFGMEVDGAQMDQQFRQYLNRGHDKMDEADALLEALRGKYALYVVTNGVKETQLLRMKNAGLDHYFTKFFVSGEIGHQKPSAAFFDHVFSEIDNFRREETLIIGDTLGADINGGLQAGIDACWYNPEGRSNDSDIEPTYEISKLLDLIEVVER